MSDINTYYSHILQAMDLGGDLIKVSTHETQCRLCLPWQGKLLSITGQTSSVPYLRDAIEAGLFHPGCAHTPMGYSMTYADDDDLKSSIQGDGMIHGNVSEQRAFYSALNRLHRRWWRGYLDGQFAEKSDDPLAAIDIYLRAVANGAELVQIHRRIAILGARHGRHAAALDAAAWLVANDHACGIVNGTELGRIARMFAALEPDEAKLYRIHRKADNRDLGPYRRARIAKYAADDLIALDDTATGTDSRSSVLDILSSHP